jgi:two-component system CheB/CheR fusion protein
LAESAKPQFCAVVVDDSRDSAESLARLITLMGCEATYVTDPRDALPEVLHKKPQIVFLDIEMPELDGYQVAAMIRRCLPPEETKLVAVTGHNEDDDRVRARKAGFDAHVKKPLDPDILDSIIKVVLQGSGQRR